MTYYHTERMKRTYSTILETTYSTKLKTCLYFVHFIFLFLNNFIKFKIYIHPVVKFRLLLHLTANKHILVIQDITYLNILISSQQHGHVC